MSQVAATQHPVIVRRGWADVGAVITVEPRELLQEVLAQQEAEQRVAPGRLGAGGPGRPSIPAVV